MSSDLFLQDLGFWNVSAPNFRHIVATTCSEDTSDWHVTISRFDNNGNEYKFHFCVIWTKFYPMRQPKICLNFGQRLMVNSNKFVGDWVVLDSYNQYTITSVLISLSNIVREIDINGIDSSIFNKHQCAYCKFGTEMVQMDLKKEKESISINKSSVPEIQVKDEKENKIEILENKVEDTMKNSSVSNLSDVSFTPSAPSIKKNDTNSVSNSSIASFTPSIVSNTSKKEQILSLKSAVKPEAKPMPKTNPKPKNSPKVTKSKSTRTPVKNNVWSGNNNHMKKVRSHLMVDENGQLKWVYTQSIVSVSLKNSNGKKFQN